ncbi:MAG: LacI family DNA-binding transcriptional regulator [Maricaulaceae bacterium]
MKKTIHDVAREAGVSIKTVSRVLNEEPNVAQSTRERVKLAAKSLNYSPNLAARSLAGSKTYLIALLYSGYSNDVLSIQNGITRACRERGYHLIVEPVGSDNEVETVLQRAPVDGVILVAPLCDDEHITAILGERKTPYKALPLPLTNAPEDAAYAATQALIAPKIA